MHQAEGGFRCRGGDGVSSAMKAWGGLGASICGGREGVRKGREASRPGVGAPMLISGPVIPLRFLIMQTNALRSFLKLLEKLSPKQISLIVVHV